MQHGVSDHGHWALGRDRRRRGPPEHAADHGDEQDHQEVTHELLIFTLVVVLVIAVACWIVHLPAPALGTQLAEGDFDGGVRHPIRVPGVGAW